MQHRHVTPVQRFVMTLGPHRFEPRRACPRSLVNSPGGAVDEPGADGVLPDHGGRIPVRAGPVHPALRWEPRGQEVLGPRPVPGDVLRPDDLPGQPSGHRGEPRVGAQQALPPRDPGDRGSQCAGGPRSRAPSSVWLPSPAPSSASRARSGSGNPSRRGPPHSGSRQLKCAKLGVPRVGKRGTISYTLGSLQVHQGRDQDAHVRGFIGFSRLARLNAARAIFVTRANRGMRWERVSSRPADRSTGLVCDQTIRHHQESSSLPSGPRQGKRHRGRRGSSGQPAAGPERGSKPREPRRPRTVFPRGPAGTPGCCPS
jgi:hypothetical protein